MVRLRQFLLALYTQRRARSSNVFLPPREPGELEPRVLFNRKDRFFEAVYLPDLLGGVPDEEPMRDHTETARPLPCNRPRELLAGGAGVYERSLT